MKDVPLEMLISIINSLEEWVFWCPAQVSLAGLRHYQKWEFWQLMRFHGTLFQEEPSAKESHLTQNCIPSLWSMNEWLIQEHKSPAPLPKGGTTRRGPRSSRDACGADQGLWRDCIQRTALLLCPVLLSLLPHRYWMKGNTFLQTDLHPRICFPGNQT